MSLHRRLDDLEPRIKQLMELGGTPGLSLSIVSAGQPDYHANYGFRNLEKSLPVTEDTIFPACSLAKAVSAAAMGILVDRGLASWETLAKDAAPSFQSKDMFLQNFTTLTDLFSHRSGMSSCGNLVGGCEANVLINKDDCMQVVNDQTLIRENRGSFAYNSTAYDLCAECIEALSQVSVEDFVRENIFRPLGMDRTFLSNPPGNVENVTECYNALDDGTPFHIPSPKIGNCGVGAASGGLQSCASELVKLYRAFLRSFNAQIETGESSTPESPLKQVAHLMSAKVPMFSVSRNEVSYGLGWARVQLPNTLGHIGLNGRLLPQGMPVIGKGVRSQLVVYHQGTLPGALAVVLLLPDTETVILVLSNSLALTDVPDWVSQMVLEEFLQVPTSSRVDFLHYAHASINVNLEWHSIIQRGLDLQRPRQLEGHRRLEMYVGLYIDSTGVFKNLVTLEDENLFWAFQGLESERFRLKHYHGNTFTWLQPRNDLSRRGRWVLGNDRDPSFWKAEFREDECGRVTRLLWKHDPLLAPIIYHKKNNKST